MPARAIILKPQSQIKKELGMDSDIVPPGILRLLGENFDPAVGDEFDDEEKLPSELEGISTRTCVWVYSFQCLFDLLATTGTTVMVPATECSNLYSLVT